MNITLTGEYISELELFELSPSTTKLLGDSQRSNTRTIDLPKEVIDRWRKAEAELTEAAKPILAAWERARPTSSPKGLL